MKNRRAGKSLATASIMFIGILAAISLPASQPPLFSYKVMAAVQNWFAGQKVEVLWKGQWYAATILASDGQRYKIHYDGYGSEWDQWVGPRHVRALVNAANSNPPNPAYTAPKLPVANFTKWTIDHNVYENGRLGMRIHLWFSINNAYQHNCKACVYFYYKDGGMLKAKTAKYSSQRDGQVSVSVPFTPGYSPATYSDLQIFMPDDELNMSPGFAQLKFQVRLYDDYLKKFVADSNFYEFNYTKQ